MNKQEAADVIFKVERERETKKQIEDLQDKLFDLEIEKSELERDVSTKIIEIQIIQRQINKLYETIGN